MNESIDGVVITGSEKDLGEKAVINLHIVYPKAGYSKIIKAEGITDEMVKSTITALEVYLAQEGKGDLLNPSNRSY